MTYTVAMYTASWKKVSDKKLSAELYNDDVINTDLIHEYLLLQQSNARVAIAHTKTRGEVRGSGKKLFSQKWTGNARVGDKKSPIRKWGWVAFGPRSEANFTKKMSKKMRRKALRGIVSSRASSDSLMGVDDWKIGEPKTKDAVAILSALDLTKKRVVVVCQPQDNDSIKRSFNNVAGVRCVSVDYLNPVDLLRSEVVLLDEQSVDYLNSLV